MVRIAPSHPTNHGTCLTRHQLNFFLQIDRKIKNNTVPVDGDTFGGTPRGSVIPPSSLPRGKLSSRPPPRSSSSTFCFRCLHRTHAMLCAFPCFVRSHREVLRRKTLYWTLKSTTLLLGEVSLPFYTETPCNEQESVYIA